MKRTSTAIGFFILFIFDLKYLSRSIQNEFNLLLVWITVCMCSNRNPNQNRAALWRIFSKSASANKKTGFYANRDPHKQEVGFILALKVPSGQIGSA